ncbi:hypothetical protein D3C80_1654720 [compost metagenome]
MAFRFHNSVIKVPFDMEGEIANQKERELWKNEIKGSKVEPFFAPCLHMYKQHTVFPYLYGFQYYEDYYLFRNEIQSIHEMLYSYFAEKKIDCLFLKDLSYTSKPVVLRWKNWGLYNQIPVALDYAI